MVEFISEYSELITGVSSAVITALASTFIWKYKSRKEKEKENSDREREFADRLIELLAKREYETIKPLENAFNEIPSNDELFQGHNVKFDHCVYRISSDEIALRTKSDSCSKILDICLPFDNQIIEIIISNTDKFQNHVITNNELRHFIMEFIGELRLCYRNRSNEIREYMKKTFH